MSIRNKLVIYMLLNSLMITTICFYSMTYLHALVELSAGLLFVFLVGISLILSLGLAGFCLSGFKNKLEALEIALLNLNDGELNSSVKTSGNDEFSKMAELIYKVSEKLRLERQHIYHRELLLDKVNQNSPVAMLLVDDYGRVVYSNQSSHYWLNNNADLDGMNLEELMPSWPANLSQAIRDNKEGVLSLTGLEADSSSKTADNADESLDKTQIWHLSSGKFTLNNQNHNLFLLKQMTREFNRQESQVWKKVIRVISHELNNSIAPISSMTHTGKMLIEPLNDKNLELIFSTIESRINHLSKFISDYAQFSRLPEPRLLPIDWTMIIERLSLLSKFKSEIENDLSQIQLDVSQFEQLLINLVKNAHESGSEQDEVKIVVKQQNLAAKKGHLISVVDRGPGMSEEVLKNALIPFYSTKQSGTGLGLALCREIVEAHKGQVSLQNREGGGLAINIWLPV